MSSEHAATIREALRRVPRLPQREGADAALSALVAEIERLRAVRAAADLLTLGALSSKDEWTSVRSGDFNALLEALRSEQ